jgi:hypothetical protein
VLWLILKWSRTCCFELKEVCTEFWSGTLLKSGRVRDGVGGGGVLRVVGGQNWAQFVSNGQLLCRRP